GFMPNTAKYRGATRSAPRRPGSRALVSVTLSVYDADNASNAWLVRFQSSSRPGATRLVFSRLAGFASMTATRRSAPGNGSGRSRTASTTENIAVVAATPRARVMRAAAANEGRRTSERQAAIHGIMAG